MYDIWAKWVEKKRNTPERRSPLAKWVGARKLRGVFPGGKAYGVCVHTTGRGIYKHSDPVGWLVNDWYGKKGSVHYLIGFQGEIYQFLDDDRAAAHVGIAKEERAKYISGSWEKDFSPAAVAAWRQRWPGFESPQHLYPTKSPNTAYIGIEIAPLEQRNDKGLLFTESQLASVASLVADINERNGLGLKLTDGTLVGHEDIDAYGRWHKNPKGPGWDPGALRSDPWFTWDTFKPYFG